jgi:hypothetical protein
MSSCKVKARSTKIPFKSWKTWLIEFSPIWIWEKTKYFQFKLKLTQGLKVGHVESFTIRKEWKKKLNKEIPTMISQPKKN